MTRPRMTRPCTTHLPDNGGPGAASMFGLFVELGPYYLNQDSYDDPNFAKTGIPQVRCDGAVTVL